jgi:hypothetical protein
VERVSSPGQEPLLLDPSVLLGDEGFAWLAEVPHHERTHFVVPRTFIDQVAGRAEYTAADEELWGPLPDEASRLQLVELIAGLATFSESDTAPYLPPEATEVVNRLRNMGSQVAVEEWLYLQSNSWLVSRSRRVLHHFKRAGAKVIEVAGNAVDDLTWLALGTRPDTPKTLTKELRIKAGFNVIVVGGISAAGVFLAPWLVIPGSVVAFLMLPLMQPAPPSPPS